MTYIDCNHASMPSYIQCPSCLTPRIAKQGQGGSTGKLVWYIGCECPAPSSIFTGFQRR